MYRIGDLAKLTGVTPDTIRYYEKQNLLRHNARTEGGFRLYTKDDLQQLRFIRYGRQLGFTLDAIKELLAIQVAPTRYTCKDSQNIVNARLCEVDARIAEFQVMRSSLQQLNDACCQAEHRSDYCSILEIFEQFAETGPPAPGAK